MSQAQETADALVTALQHALSQPPARVGRRLRPESELVERLGVNRWRLREAINALVQQGVLVRRRGSGTFLREIPSAPATVERAEGLGFDPALLFADPERSAPGPGPWPGWSATSGMALRIGVWQNPYSNSFTVNRLQAQLHYRLGELGHRTIPEAVTDPQGHLLSVERIAAVLESQPFDAHLVRGNSAERFVEAMRIAGVESVPCVFYGGGRPLLPYGPCIGTDASSAIVFAMTTLAEQGFRRIAMLRRGWFDPLLRADQPDYRIETYDMMVRRLELSYRSVHSTPRRLPESDVDAMETAMQMMEGPHPPDAVYVGDEHLLTGACEAFKRLDCLPGRDIGLITLTNRGCMLPPEFDWSRLEFSIDHFVRAICDALITSACVAGEEPSSLRFQPRWCPGRTHYLLDPKR